MQVTSGFPQDLNSGYYIRQPTKRDILEETIYYKKDEVIKPPPVEVVHRPIIKDTIFLPDRQAPPPVPVREAYRVSPVLRRPPLGTTTTTTTAPTSRFSLLPALGLNADCPCWAWICIILGFVVLLTLLGLLLYFILDREGRI